MSFSKTIKIKIYYFFSLFKNLFFSKKEILTVSAQGNMIGEWPWNGLLLGWNSPIDNFLITSLNRMNQTFLCRQKYFLWETKFWKFYFEFCDFLVLPNDGPMSYMLGLRWHNFCSWAPIETKIIFPKKCCAIFNLLRKFWKITTKIKIVGAYRKSILLLVGPMGF